MSDEEGRVIGRFNGHHTERLARGGKLRVSLDCRGKAAHQEGCRARVWLTDPDTDKPIVGADGKPIEATWTPSLGAPILGDVDANVKLRVPRDAPGFPDPVQVHPHPRLGNAAAVVAPAAMRVAPFAIIAAAIAVAAPHLDVSDVANLFDVSTGDDRDAPETVESAVDSGLASITELITRAVVLLTAKVAIPLALLGAFVAIWWHEARKVRERLDPKCTALSTVQMTIVCSAPAGKARSDASAKHPASEGTTAQPRVTPGKWRDALARHEALDARWHGYETDLDAILARPLMRDLTDPAVAEAVRAMADARRLRADTPPPDGADEYLVAVDRYEQALDAAERKATTHGADAFTTEEQDGITQAQRLLSIAMGGGSESERQFAYNRVIKIVRELRRLSVPDEAIEKTALEAGVQIRGLIEAAPDQTPEREYDPAQAETP